jgi:hypothetical protein
VFFLPSDVCFMDGILVARVCVCVCVCVIEI